MTAPSRGDVLIEPVLKDSIDGGGRIVFRPATDDSSAWSTMSGAQLTSVLGIDVPDSWPPRPVPPPEPDGNSGWRIWFIVLADSASSRIIGTAAVRRRGAENDALQFGITLLPEYQGQQLGREIVMLIGKWGLSHPDVSRVITQIPEGHAASIKTAEHAGFVPAEASSAGFLIYQLTRF